MFIQRKISKSKNDEIFVNTIILFYFDKIIIIMFFIISVKPQNYLNIIYSKHKK
jgi:hypothetical protein